MPPNVSIFEAAIPNITSLGRPIQVAEVLGNDQKMEEECGDKECPGP
jgi:hypothetical protein